MRVRVAVLLLSLTLSAHADDGAASIAAGGIVLMKKEPRITMAKEVLFISPTKIIVDYDFRNDSNEDITTLVAFPIPDYTLESVVPYDFHASPGFEDFRLWVDGNPLTYRIEARAFIGHREITTTLRALRIDIGTFGRYSIHPGHSGDSQAADIVRLSPVQRQRLAASGAIDAQTADASPQWTVRKKYLWTQTFPAHQTVHIRHEYTPFLGSSNTIGEPKDFEGKNVVPEYAMVCPDAALRSTLESLYKQLPPNPDFGAFAGITYVDFILTTANTWKTPIEDFTLTIERPKPYKGEKTYVSFCWDGDVTATDPDHFTAHLTNFVPRKELMIGFIMPYSKQR